MEEEEDGDREEGSSSVGEPLVTQGRILTAAQICVVDPCSLHPSSPGGQLQVGVQGHVEMGATSPVGKCGGVQKHLHCHTTAPLSISAQPERRGCDQKDLGRFTWAPLPVPE